MKKILFFILLIVAASFLVLPKKENIANKNAETKEEKLAIVTSFYPLYFLTKEITGDQAVVANLTKTGVEPHDYEPNTSDIKAIENSQLLIVNGNFFESWLDQFEEQIDPQKTKVLKVADGLADLEKEEDGRKEIDAHVWLDPVLAAKEAELISAKLQKIDPKNTDLYQKNTKTLIEKLAALDQEFQLGLANCQKNKVITSHAAFAYMAKRYSFEQIAIQGLNPDDDPSAAQIANITKLAKANNINYIFFETLLSPKISETIAKEIGGETLVFNPIEGLSAEEEQNGEDYFSIQRNNLANLRLALDCK